ncbi:hypothetical protein BU24DRAFT_496850 [Aaosphaeria arxii CBS 175.79]|uniref:Zn(2)-C6 fungal-type domain-containing protein n=1 Tax=Aaosphaeria arxii CBS 175.79 TaxID=1450172 RepID=A0A6A5XAG7_9PLEO|nr:uncharacterized protein BU24DRAFT_496850 [Aaosphaeria arxii CBS 175.79]KAF2010055.1 hypothetical protein BU24DRAFT_496850 [Aaosphaeria arxii CBS 175.79]
MSTNPNRATPSSRGYRSLLPAIGGVRPVLPENHSTKKVRLACNVCRTRKIRCDGHRPICGHCQQHSVSCIYVEEDNREMRPTVLRRENIALREKVTAYQQIIGLIANMPADAAQSAMWQLQNGSDPTNLLRSLRSKNMGSTVSQVRTFRAALPAAVHSQGELELLVRHPLVYPALDLSPRAQSLGKTLVNPVRDLGLPPADQLPKTFDNPSRNQHPEEGAASGALYFDSRLASLHIDFWTTVPVSNSQAAEAISAFLEFQHPVWGVFDATLFVRDLVEHRFDFCSSFLVSSLLAVAFQTHALVDREALGRSLKFAGEAEMLLRSVSEDDCLSTLAGLALLSIHLTGQGKFTPAASCLIKAKAMAERMKLFGVMDSLLVSSLESKDQLEATSGTAWGVFNMIVHQSRFYSWIEPVKVRPALPVPGDPVESPPARDNVEAWSLPISERVDGNASARGAFCRLWVIINEVQLLLRSPDNDGTTSLAFALSKFSDLLHLADTLPHGMRRGERTPNSALVFYMHLHTIILDLFRPFLAPEIQQSHKKYLSLGTQPSTIFAASVEQLKSLLFEYTHQFPAPQWNIYIYVAVIYAASAVLNDEHDPERRMYCLFYAQCGLKHRPAVQSIGKIGESILAMGYDRNVLQQAEVAQFKKMAEYNDNDERRGPPGGGFSVNRNSEPGNDADVDTLAGRFEDIVIFDEFTESVA